MLPIFAIVSLRQKLFFVPDNSAQWFDQLLDHFNPQDKTTFKQRYYENLTFIPSDGFSKVLLYIGGEATLGEKSVISGSITELAKRTNSAIFALEHRFFGETMPFTELTPGNLTYLTIEQGLADLAHFMGFIQSHQKSKGNVTFIVVGGSYPGALSSWFRLKYPNLAVASWASSAPVHIKNDFPEYDAYVASQLEHVSEKCLTNTKDVFKHAEDIITSGDAQKISDLKTELGFNQEQDPISVLYVITDVVAAMVQYNSRYQILTEHCANQESSETGNWSGFVGTFKKMLNLTGETTVDFDLLEQTSTSSTSTTANGRSWSWMTCNEVGWFQTASGKLRSSLINLNYFQRVCKTLFGIGMADSDEMNRKFGSDNPRQTKVFFVNGGVDPWSTLSVKVADESIMRRALVIANESHCADLYPISDSDKAPLKTGKEEIINQMKAWMTEMSCNGTCIHGTCFDSRCACDLGWGGSDCGTEMVEKIKYDTAIITGVSIPVTSVVLIIFATWWWYYKRKPAIDNRPLLKAI